MYLLVKQNLCSTKAIIQFRNNKFKVAATVNEESLFKLVSSESPRCRRNHNSLTYMLKTIEN